MKDREFLSTAAMGLLGYSLMVSVDEPSAGVGECCKKAAAAGQKRGCEPTFGQSTMQNVKLDCDVLVAGGGLTGVCASLAAARSGAKVVRKAAPDERVGVLCTEDGRPSIAEYYEMTEEMATARKENGDLKYGFGVILNYLFSEKKLEQIADAKMPIHVVEKKIPYMDADGTFVKPEQPNGYKFETLVLDMVHMMDNCIPYEVVREREFAPIKNLHGVDSLDTARELLKGCGIQL